VTEVMDDATLLQQYREEVRAGRGAKRRLSSRLFWGREREKDASLELRKRRSA